jgi:AsmA-like C-terminal region/Putative zinc-finger
MGLASWGRSRAARRANDAGTPEIRRLVRLALADPGSAGSTGADLAAGPGHPSEFVVAAYIEGRLSEAAEETFERHIAFCPSCAEELVIARRSGVGESTDPKRAAWMKIAAALAIVLGGLIAALLAAGAVGGRLEATVLAGLRDALGDRARVDAVAFTLEGGPGVELSGLAVADPGGGQPMIVAPSARWNVDLGKLRRGRIAGALELRGAVINVVREPSGELNIDAILPGSGGREDLMAKARRKAVDAVEISDGTLRLIDRSGGERRELRMAAVDASFRNLSGTSPAQVSAKAGIESERQNFRVAGEVGPWGEGQKPAYRFPEVALDGVPVRNLPGIGGSMRGGLSFSGSLSSAGDRWAEISTRFSGSGDLRLVSGAIAGRNLVREVVAPVLGDGGSQTTLPPALAALAAGDETTFAEIHSPVTIVSSRMRADDLFASTTGFAVAGHGSLALDGRVDFQGEVTASESITREILALAPGAGSLVGERGEIAIPFRVAGTWPDVRVAVDVERLAARTLLRDRLARLFGWLMPALARPFA